MSSHANYSEQTASLIDSEVKEIVSEGLNKARKLLSENKKLLDVMARLLIEKETIYTEEVDMIMDGKSVEEILSFMESNEKSSSDNPFERRNPTIVKKASSDNQNQSTETEKEDTPSE